MSVDIRDPLWVWDASVMASIRVRGAVLGDVDVGELVVAVQAHEEVLQPERIDLPPHLGALDAVDLDLHRQRGLRSRANHAPAVVVDSEEVERCTDRLQVVGLDHGQDALVLLEHVARIAEPEHGLEEPAIASAVRAPSGLDIRLRARERVRRVQVDGHADACLWRIAAKHLRCSAVREEDVMRGGQRVRLAPAPRSVHAQPVPEPRDDPGLVLGDPVAHPVAEPGDDDLRVLRERLHRIAGGPTAAVLERLGQIPVIQRDVRLDPAREQLVDDAVVVVEAGRVHAPGPVGKHARP